MDFGAGVNCATRKQFPNATPRDAPSITLTTADKKNMENQEAMKMITGSKEGSATEQIFYDAPVETPILSVADIARKRDMVSKTTFLLQDGCIENIKSQQRQHFVKRKGVYFMKLYTERKVDNDPNAEMDFARPGNP